MYVALYNNINCIAVMLLDAFDHCTHLLPFYMFYTCTCSDFCAASTQLHSTHDLGSCDCAGLSHWVYEAREPSFTVQLKVLGYCCYGGYFVQLFGTWIEL